MREDENHTPNSHSPSEPTPRVFLDIGAHLGETLDVVIQTRWHLDQIHCFEPAGECIGRLSEVAGDDPRVQLHRVALWHEAGTIELHGAGGVGASLFPTKPGISPTTERVSAVDTAAYLANCLPSPVDLFIKVNVEGAEREVLAGIQQLLWTDGRRKIRAIYCHIDADKIAGHEDRAADARTTLAEIQPNDRGDAAFFGKNITAKTRNWLRFSTSGPAVRLLLLYILRPLHLLRLRLWRLRRRLRLTV